MPAQRLIQTQKQSLKINPQQIQFLNFLQLNELEIEELIKKELEENPILEERETEEEYDNKSYQNNYNTENRTDGVQMVDLQKAASGDLRSELKEQIKYLNYPKKDKKLALFLLESVDEKGFLKSTDEELEDVISFAGGAFYTAEEISLMRANIQNLEPFGVGSVGLNDYLLIQAEKLKASELAKMVLENHFEQLTEHDFDSISSGLNVDKEKLKDALKEISNFKPYPFYGYEFGGEQGQQILPEFKVELREGKPVGGILTGDKRRLQFNEAYLEVLSYEKDKKAKRFLAQKAEDARWFLEAIAERNRTMSACIAAIVKLQEEYFISGNTSELKPMILKDIAELTGRTISTISRVTSQKFVETQFGIIPLKSLFSEGIQKNNGEFISNREVQDFVNNLVSLENKAEPLTDAQIQVKLEERGVTLTRRTITKYRENLNIPSSKLRRAL